ncbi:MAG: indolepyruvate oxidoreductase subunit beta [Smithellaceae bacterium]|jgi:indolepyruvate ferredoxin oxidoreductase beta subunit|nr:indolepyruvate oxidoreductase subunit beta [Smithellaceae bacterium]MDD3258982.1 indolepyruvate oxidoreductase subunit beta [Smithellaceae bacterium]MDD3848972.1 indolepyruvate oxidoreductase subunit beta [Smithellaceae bacterium]HOG11354.1 indolepyruvate oxidoreductase subunit beta [Smithellaceae bacterium]
MKSKSQKVTLNLILTGVGGQGNVMASRTLAGMLVDAGYVATIGETFGMSQRGGSVMSHLRISPDAVRSPQIPRGAADVIVALEPLEALRVLTMYGNPEVSLIANSRSIDPVGVITGERDYPSEETIRSAFERLTARYWLFDATAAGLSLGNPVLSNIVMIGALAGTGLLPIDRRMFAKEIRKTQSPEKCALNLKAFDAGVSMIK